MQFNQVNLNNVYQYPGKNHGVINIGHFRNFLKAYIYLQQLMMKAVLKKQQTVFLSTHHRLQNTARGLLIPRIIIQTVTPFRQRTQVNQTHN